MKARKVKGLRPEGALSDNVERIVRVRLDELCSFMPRAEDPKEVEALHNMRIAAKRLRYILEIAHGCFGEYAKAAVKLTKELQDLLGEIHDCDVQVPAVQAFLDELVAKDAEAVRAAAGDAGDLDPALVERAPERDAYAGLVSLVVYLEARRQLLFDRFQETWREYQRRGFRARLEFAVSERSELPPEALPAVADLAEALGDLADTVSADGVAHTLDTVAPGPSDSIDAQDGSQAPAAAPASTTEPS